MKDDHSDYSSGELSLRRVEFCCLEGGRAEHVLNLGSDCDAPGGLIMLHLLDWPNGRNARTIAVTSIEADALRGHSNSSLAHRSPSGDLRKQGERRCGEDVSRFVCSLDAFS
jgi:hypothetical protein